MQTSDNRGCTLKATNRITMERGDVEEILEPFAARLTAIAASPVINYAHLKALLGELAVATKGITAAPDLELRFWQCFSEEDVASFETDVRELLEP